MLSYSKLQWGNRKTAHVTLAPTVAVFLHSLSPNPRTLTPILGLALSSILPENNSNRLSLAQAK
jgi:hypothetical protein